MKDRRKRKAATKKRFKKPAGKLEPVDLKDYGYYPSWMTRAYVNNRYTVTIQDEAEMTNGITAISAMIQRLDNLPFINHWREIQNIKNEIFGHETTAIEYYPAESELIDDENIYWIFILPKDALPIYIRKGDK